MTRQTVASFKAYNYDASVKATACTAAALHQRATGVRHVVEYRDHYDDSRVAGDYVVVRVS